MLRTMVLALVLFFMLAPAQAQQGRPLAEIPYRLDYNGLAIINVEINGSGPYDFIVDTGATMTVLFENLLVHHPDVVGTSDTRRVIGMSSVERLSVHIIDEVRIGPLGFDKLPAVTVRDWGSGRLSPQGIIGLDILENFFVQFDTRNRLIRLYPADHADTVETAWTAVPLSRYSTNSRKRHVYAVDVKIQGTDIPMIVDLGAEDAIINYEALWKTLKGVYTPGYELGGRGLYFGAKYSDLYDNKESAQLIKTKRIVIGDSIWMYPQIVVFDALVFEELGVADKPFGMLGARIMLSRNFALDFKNARLLIGPASDRESAQLNL